MSEITDAEIRKLRETGRLDPELAAAAMTETLDQLRVLRERARERCAEVRDTKVQRDPADKAYSRNVNKQITIARAKATVENAPNYDRDTLIAHVRDALQDAYDEGKRAAGPEAREASLRLELAYARGAQQAASTRVTTLELELRDHTQVMGKTTVI